MSTPNLKVPTDIREQFVWPDEFALMIILSDGKEKKRIDITTSVARFNRPWRDEYEYNNGLKNPHIIFYKAFTSKPELEAYMEIISDTLDAPYSYGRRDPSFRFFDNGMTDIMDFAPNSVRRNLVNKECWAKEMFDLIEDRQVREGIIPFPSSEDLSKDGVNAYWESTITNLIQCCGERFEEYLELTLTVVAPDPSADQTDYILLSHKNIDQREGKYPKDRLIYSSPNKETLELNRKIKQLVEESQGKPIHQLTNKLFQMIK